MHNFKLIRQGIHVDDLSRFLLSDESMELWLNNTVRQRLSVALKDTFTIHLRKLPILAKNVNESNEVLDVIDNPAIVGHPMMKVVKSLCDSIYDEEKSERYGRIFISRLKAGCHIGRHVDEGSYFNQFTNRYHIVVSANDECKADIDGEISAMLSGEAWLVNNHVPHMFWNGGTTDRINIIIDTVPKRCI